MNRRSLFLAAPALALALSVAAQTQTAAPPATPAVLIENVRIFDGSGSTLSAPSNVLVVGNKISQISTARIAADPAHRLTTVKGGGRTLMPGLSDVHVHLFMSASSQAELMDPKATFESLEAKAAAEAERMLLRGFTAVRDVGGPVFGLKRAIDQGKTIGPRIYPSGAMISQTSGHGDFRMPSDRSRRFGGQMTAGELMGVGFIADGRDEVLTATRENLRGGATQIKVMAGGGAASAYDPLDVSQYTLDEMKAAVEAADDWGTYVTVHAYTPKAVRRAVEAGVKCIEHGQLLDEPTFQWLGEKGVWLSLQTLEEAPATAAPETRAKKKTVVEGTDNAELLALSGPRNPYPGKLGVVEVGALADLLLVDGDPLANLKLIADPAKNLLVIMKDGKVYKNLLP